MLMCVLVGFCYGVSADVKSYYLHFGSCMRAVSVVIDSMVGGDGPVNRNVFSKRCSLSVGRQFDVASDNLLYLTEKGKWRGVPEEWPVLAAAWVSAIEASVALYAYVAFREQVNFLVNKLHSDSATYQVTGDTFRFVLRVANEQFKKDPVEFQNYFWSEHGYGPQAVTLEWLCLDMLNKMKITRAYFYQ